MDGTIVLTLDLQAAVAHGRKGGKVKSAAKTAAARRDGPLLDENLAEAV
jgi:hypothetical protein